jgi:RNA polymerase sigma-70 factor (ECF subfamily)
MRNREEMAMAPSTALERRESTREADFEAAAFPHLDDLYRAASHIIGDRTEAEDLVQETYLQAWKSFDRFELGTNCRAWLFKILFHVVQHHRRKWFRIKLTDNGDEVFEQTLVYEPPVPQDLTDEDIIESFQKIPQQYREVVLLSDVYDFTYKEISETLGIPQGTVMSRLSRGRQQLRDVLANYAELSQVQSGERVV